MAVLCNNNAGVGDLLASYDCLGIVKTCESEVDRLYY